MNFNRLAEPISEEIGQLSWPTALVMIVAILVAGFVMWVIFKD